MRSRLLALVSALSLLVCVITVVLWVRSYWHSDSVEYNTAVRAQGNESVSAMSAYGRLFVSCFKIRFVPTLREEFISDYNEGHSDAWTGCTTWRGKSVNDPSLGKIPWFGCLHIGEGGNPPSNQITPWYEGYRVTFPTPLVTLLSAILPAVYLKRKTRAHLLAIRGQCRNCGYDLRATPDRCPECGTAVPRKQGITA